jgi:hypothetical protein
MKPLNALIGWFLLGVAFLFYGYGVYRAIEVSWPPVNPNNISQYPVGLDAAIASINAILLTNLGAVLGISISNPNSALARNILPAKGTVVAPAISAPMDSREQIQLLAVIIYLISLIACFVTWLVSGFETDPTKILAFVAQSAKMFIGVVVAYLTLILR